MPSISVQYPSSMLYISTFKDINLRHGFERYFTLKNHSAVIIVQVAIYRRVRIGRDGHLDQSEACDI